MLASFCIALSYMVLILESTFLLLAHRIRVSRSSFDPAQLGISINLFEMDDKEFH